LRTVWTITITLFHDPLAISARAIRSRQASSLPRTTTSSQSIRPAPLKVPSDEDSTQGPFITAKLQSAHAHAVLRGSSYALRFTLLAKAGQMARSRAAKVASRPHDSGRLAQTLVAVKSYSIIISLIKALLDSSVRGREKGSSRPCGRDGEEEAWRSSLAWHSCKQAVLLGRLLSGPVSHTGTILRDL
jgi:hypothetical protein